MTNIKKGEIYLANLGDKTTLDIGKIRPVLIFQNNFLNRMLNETKYQDDELVTQFTQKGIKLIKVVLVFHGWELVYCKEV